MNTTKHARKRKSNNQFKQKANESKQKHLYKLSSNANIKLNIKYGSNKRKLDEPLKDMDLTVNVPDKKSKKGEYLGLNIKRNKIGAKKKRKICSQASESINNELKTNGMCICINISCIIIWCIITNGIYIYVILQYYFYLLQYYK